MYIHINGITLSYELQKKRTLITAFKKKNTMKTKWKIDPMHSEVQFKIRHLVISTVTGNFGTFDATVETEADGGDSIENALVHFTADANSISTGAPQRDTHLKSPDFFDTVHYSTIDFHSTEITKTGKNSYKMTGNLTMHGVTKPIELDVEYGGMMKDPYGNTKVGFEVTGSVDRKDFGLSWNAMTEAGGVVVSDNVKILCNVQFVKVEKEELVNA